MFIRLPILKAILKSSSVSSSPRSPALLLPAVADQYLNLARHVHHNHRGARLLLENAVTKGMAFTEEERAELGILGLLPPGHRTQDLQVKAALNFVNNIGDNLTKYIYLRNLKDYNERMFYKTLAENVEALMPIVYTPVVGLACQKFSHIYLRPRGLYVTINDLGRVRQVVANWPYDSVHATVVTDGERVLGLGDLGANGMGISIGKLSLYTALAGIPPHTVLPVCLDVGTNNKSLLEDPFYIGLRHERVTGDNYFRLIDEFMSAVVERFGKSCLIQFEDFANQHAFTLLEKYQDQYCTFNDDIQGTASVCLSGLISASRLAKTRVRDHTFLYFGAGEANLGSASLLVEALVDEGLDRQEALDKIWMMDNKGLVVEGRDSTNWSSHKKMFQRKGPMMNDFMEILDMVKPTVLIGASAATGAFTKDVLKKMTTFAERPIIFALSNPNSKAECTAAQAYEHTRGKCIFASGSPFEPVEFNGKTYTTGQGNNSYIFPGIALAVMAAQAPSIPDKAFIVASKALSEHVLESELEAGLVYPRIGRIRDVTLHVASKVMEFFYAEGLTNYHFEPKDKLAFLRDIQYDYNYDKPQKVNQ
uniref:Malic enzyme n=1 Tax=Aceria tosichella TaxID=561515 RepID=A0A6G1S4G9_9ACAR